MVATSFVDNGLQSKSLIMTNSATQYFFKIILFFSIWSCVYAFEFTVINYEKIRPYFVNGLYYSKDSFFVLLHIGILYWVIPIYMIFSSVFELLCKSDDRPIMEIICTRFLKGLFYIVIISGIITMILLGIYRQRFFETHRLYILMGIVDLAIGVAGISCARRFGVKEKKKNGHSLTL